MAATLSRIFSAQNSNFASSAPKKIPMLNSLTSSLGSFLREVHQTRKKKSLMAWFKAIPELTALSNKVAKDIVYDWHFEPVVPGQTGRNKILKANKFATQVNLSRVMYSQVMDMLITGEGFGWIGKLQDSDIKKEISKRVSKEIFLKPSEKKMLSKRIFKEMKGDYKRAIEFKQEDQLSNLQRIDEDTLKPRKYRYIASTTMEIVHDQFDIKEYHQVVGMNQIKFSKEEIIRYSFMDVDGKVSGFTPVESIVVQLELLRQMWQNMLSIYKNGGAPDKLFILENTKVSTAEYKRIQEQLQKYKLVENKHGNMVFTGKVTVEDLQQMDQMQFKDSGLYITGLVAMQWQIPRSSIPYIIGGTNTKDDTGGNSERGYWRNISFAQEAYANVMNNQLWMPHFGVRLVFNNAFIQQDVQEETAKGLKYTNIESMDRILSRSKKRLNEEKRKKLLGLSDQDLEDIPEEEQLQFGQENSFGAQGNQLPKDSSESLDKRNKNNKKKQEQISSQESQGMKPTGVGKEKMIPANEFWFVKKSSK